MKKLIDITSFSLTLALTLFLGASVVNAQDFQGSGFADSRMNDCFIASSTPSVGSAVWSNVSNTYFLVHSGTDSYIRSSDLSTWIDPYFGPPPSVEYYMNGATPVSASWNDNGGGLPVGSFTATTCAIPPSPSPTASTTVTTVDNPTLDFFMGVIMFFMTASFIIWLFK